MRSSRITVAALSIAFASLPVLAAPTVLSTTTQSQDVQVKNGLVAKRGEYLEAVVIDVSVAGKPAGLCTGVLITPTVVLSAGHCAWRKGQPVRVSAVESYAQVMKVQAAGVSTPAGQDYPQSVAVASFQVMNPAAVQAGATPLGSDLMLLRLASPLDSPVHPIAIAQLSNLADVKVVRVVGFGENGKKNYGTKLWADVDVVSPRCDPTAAAKPSDALCSEGAELLARHPEKTFDTCPGDSGGPVYARGTGGAHYLIGITSRAPLPSQQCGGGTFVTLLDGDRLAWIRTAVPDAVVGPAFQPEAAPKIAPKGCEKIKPNPTC